MVTAFYMTPPHVVNRIFIPFHARFAHLLPKIHLAPKLHNPLSQDHRSLIFYLMRGALWRNGSGSGGLSAGF